MQYHLVYSMQISFSNPYLLVNYPDEKTFLLSILCDDS